MRYIFFVLFLICGHLFAQPKKTTDWQMSYSVAQAEVGEVIEVVFSVSIDKAWYLYSSDFDPECGPKVTTFNFLPHPSYELVGKIYPAQKPKKKFDDVFGCDYTYFMEKAEFRQKIKIKDKNLEVKGNVDFQTCTVQDGMCIPFDYEFPFGKIPKITIASGAEKKNELESSQPDPVAQIEPQPEEQATQAAVSSSRVDYDKKSKEKESLWAFMILAFVSGIAAIFTPCVFPMVPLTVSFFSKKNKIHALVYSLSIVGIYSLIGAILAPVMGPSAAYVLSTHWLPNLLFFTIFLLFALSFFGMFDIVLPSSLVNAMDKNSEKGGFLGTFFMAFTLVLVSFSCTGPIVGSILIASAGGEVLKPVVGMFSFSAAFALPFGLFAFFPSLILDNKGRSKVKSGGWLNSVKVTLGFVELALAFKFLSMIDLIYHFGILDRDVNVAIWMAISLFLGLYYLGKIQLPHDSPVTHISVPRMLLALLCFSFFMYLLPGMFGAPLNSLSGILPPTTTHSFDLAHVVRQNSGGGAGESELTEEPLYGDKLHFPHGLKGYFDYEQAMRVAKKLNKPVFVDFTGHSCANCRKMEDAVWPKPEVLKRLKNDYVLLALYADESSLKPESTWYTSRVDGRMKRTIGQQNLDFQIEKFSENAQPLYVLLDHDGSLLQSPRAFDTDVSAYVQFLDAGLQEFKNRRK